MPYIRNPYIRTYSQRRSDALGARRGRMMMQRRRNMRRSYVPLYRANYNGYVNYNRPNYYVRRNTF